MENKAIETVKATPNVIGLLGLELKGQIWKDAKTGSIAPAIPGGRNFGGCLMSKLEVANIAGRQVAISGSTDANGDAVLNGLESAVLTAFYLYEKDKAGKMIQDISLNGHVRSIRFAMENKTGPKAPLAAYYISI